MKFIEDIEKDIKAYTKILERGNINEASQCVKEIEFVYGKRVDGLNGLYRNAVWDGDVDWLGLLKNSIRIIEFYMEEYIIKYDHNKKLGINRLNTTDDELIPVADISESVTTVLEMLEGTMSDQEYKEVTEKLKELEGLNQLDLSAGKKWLQTRSVIEWSVTKGVDVFILLMPIVYKILKPEVSKSD